MRNLYILFLGILFIIAFSASPIRKAQAQLTVNQGAAIGLTPLQLVQQVLVGTGVTVSNATFNGSAAVISSNMIGSFTTAGGATSQLGFTGGIILASGNAADAVGPNSSESSGTSSGTGSDPDLQLLVTTPVYDAAVLEFDFVPLSDTVRFRYVYGSEEFDEFCNSSFNDAFGFFISGPGITGPFSNNAKNIAVMPNNPANYVTINIICNAGATYSWLNTSGTYYQYDRLTMVYTSWSVVQPCQTYHIKLAIGDAGDSSFDSGVFLEENSFTSNAVSHSTTFSSSVDTLAIEGCNNAIITFHLANTATSAVTINHTVGGTAVESVDYLDIPNNFVIPTGQNSLNITITPISDNISEATETVVITYTNSVCGTTDMVVVLIKNYEPLSSTATPDVYTCSGLPSTIGVTVAGGLTPPPLTYLWSDNAGNSASVVVDPPTPTIYYVTVSDACNYSIVDSVMVAIGNPVSIITSVVPETCTGDNDGSATVTASNGFVPYHYQWSPANDTTATADNLGAGTYTVTVVDSYGCSNTANVIITVTPTDNPAFNYPSSSFCQTGTDPSANITGGAAGAFTSAPPGLIFLNSATGLIDVSASAVNTYTVTFLTNGNCPSSSTAGVTITAPPTAAFYYAGPYCQNAANPSPTLGPGASAGTFSASPAGLVFVNTSNGQVNLAASTTGTYTVTNSIAAAGGCSATSATANVTINPLPSVNVPANIIVCNTNIIAATNFISTPMGSTFTWTNSNTAIGLAAGGSGNIASFTATNTGAAPISATITVIPTLNNCTGPSSTYTITVNPTPTVTVPANITVCNNGNVSASNFVSTPGGGTFTWTNSNAAIGLSTSGSGNIPSFTATNSGTTPISATITVIATVNSCAGTPSTYTITVNPTPTVTVPANITVCNNGTVSATNFNSVPNGGTYVWTNSNAAIGIPASGAGNIASFIATNTGTAPISASITVIPTVNNCTGTPSTYTITVNPTPIVVVPANIVVCDGNTVPGTLFTSPTAGATYAWTNSNTAIGLTASGYGDVLAFTATDNGTTPISATITVTPTTNTCTGTPSSYTIAVNPLPVITFFPMPQICYTSPVFTLSQASPAGGIYSGSGVTGSTFDPAVAGIGTHTITYNYTNPVTGCSNTDTTHIVISGLLTITVTPNNPFICDGNNILLTASGAYTYSWQPNTGLSSSTGSVVVASPANTTTYSVIGNNPNGCMGSATVSVGIYNVPELSVTSVTKEGCSPLDVTFGYGPLGPIDTNTLMWNFGDLSSANNNSTLTTPTHTFNNNGNYTIFLSARTTDDCLVSATDTVKVYLKPIADFYNNPIIAYADNPKIDFIDLSIHGNSWEWNFGDPASYNNNYSDGQNPTHLYSEPGTYPVQLIVYSDQSCSDTIQKTVTIYPEIIVFIPNAFTPNDDDMNDTFSPIITGADTENYEFYIYNRWGNIQFFTDDMNTAWNGKNNDKYNDSGVYIYYVVYQSITGEKFKLKGLVTLIR